MLGLFVLCVGFAYLPQLESISAGMVNLKLSKNIEEAKELLPRVKALAGIDAKVAYSLLAWTNRLSGMPLREKQGMADEIDSQLRSYGVSEGDIDAIKSKYVTLIGYDLSIYFDMTLSQYIINRYGSKRMNDTELTNWSQRWNSEERTSVNKLIGITGLELARATPRTLSSSVF
jgi:hypothetical protein